MNLKPLGDRVIIKQADAEEKTASGLLLASASKEKPQRGCVLAVGEGKLDKDGNLVKPQVNVGDTVIYAKFGGTTVEYQGQEYVILRADDILAVIL
ncbi:MAG: co-chaperone GroES [Coriobacteriales bacterium]|nr:co-chaperone GroES [Coriobacteriales bacterium]